MLMLKESFVKDADVDISIALDDLKIRLPKVTCLFDCLRE